MQALRSKSIAQAHACAWMAFSIPLTFAPATTTPTGPRMDNHKIVSSAEWIEARKQLLAGAKEFNRLRDRLPERRRNMPWEAVNKEYSFAGPNGKRPLAQLFDGRTQLIVYHFMFAPEWEAGCKSCSWWAENFERNVIHLKRRDATLIAISRAPVVKLE